MPPNVRIFFFTFKTRLCSAQWRRRLTLLRYSEGVEILYTRNLFDLNHIVTLQHLASTVLPERFNQIRSLQLTWDIGTISFVPEAWKTTWSTIAGMKGLKSLHVVLYESGYACDRSPAKENMVLGPMYEVLQTEEFDVEMPSAPHEDVWPRRKTPPFVLKYSSDRSYQTMVGPWRGILPS